MDGTGGYQDTQVVRLSMIRRACDLRAGIGLDVTAPSVFCEEVKLLIKWANEYIGQIGNTPIPASTLTTTIAVNSSIILRTLLEMLAVGDYANHRTLHEIIWSCLTTMFACTWIALHPGVPQSSHRTGTPTAWDNFKWRGMLTLGVIIAPDSMLLWAIEERLLAAKIVEAYNRFCDTESADTSASISAGRSKWTLTHAFFLIMDGFMLYDEQGQPIGPLTPTMLFEALETKEPANWPPLTISREEIEDKSKGDFFTKLVVVVHATWFAMQCIARIAMGLPLVGLEVITLAFAMMNITTYAMWWYKPQNVNLPISIVLTRPPEAVVHPSPQVASTTSNNMRGITQEVHETDSTYGECFQSDLQALYYNARKEGSSHIEQLFTTLSLSFTVATKTHSLKKQVGCEALALRLTLALVPTILGSFHLFYWSAIFPSMLERFLWRSSSIMYLVIQPLISWHPLGLLHDVKSNVNLGLRQDSGSAVQNFQEVVMRCVLLSFPAYCFARFVLFFIALSSLRSLPEAVFVQVYWSRYIPHFQ